MTAAAKTIRRIALFMGLLGLLSLAPAKLSAAASAPPDGLMTTWTHERTDLSLTLRPDGTYKARFFEWEATGTFSAAAGLLTFITADGSESQVPYVCDGKKLILLQKGQASLVLTAPAAAPAIVPDPQGVLPAAALDRPAVAFAYADRALVRLMLRLGTAASADIILLGR